MLARKKISGFLYIQTTRSFYNKFRKGSRLVTWTYTSQRNGTSDAFRKSLHRIGPGRRLPLGSLSLSLWRLSAYGPATGSQTGRMDIAWGYHRSKQLVREANRKRREEEKARRKKRKRKKGKMPGYMKEKLPREELARRARKRWKDT